MNCENGFVILKLANLNQNRSCHLKKKHKQTKKTNQLASDAKNNQNLTSKNLIITNIITKWRFFNFLLDL